MVPRFSLIALILLVPALAAAQDAAALSNRTPNTLTAPDTYPGPRATIADLAWFEGRWVGTGLGGTTEETWSAPAGGAMMGMFRLSKGDAVVFYEFLTLVEHEGSLLLKLKHFNPDLTGWEEKADSVKFRLLKLTPSEASFGGLTFRRTGADTMQIFLALRNRTDGTVREEAFEARRVKNE
jgi:hypothetical protein